MSEREGFLSRWSRLKHESSMEEIEGEKPADGVPSTAAAFDPASLPPIESIVADSDVRPFLAAGVPAELTRAALRSAWAADPAIRDFIGIAESQWDFNRSDAIPGFGPLAIEEYRRALEAQALAGASAAEARREDLDRVEAPAAAHIDVKSAPAQAVCELAAALPDRSSEPDSAGRGEAAATPGASARRRHGGALPK